MTQELVSATEQLANTLALENAALRALDLPAAGMMLAEKQAATANFAAVQRRVMAARPALDLKALRAAALRLKTETDENRRLLERAIGVQTRVLGILAIAARAADPAPRYARSGVYAKRTTSSWALSASA
jgi:hypothetical protein